MQPASIEPLHETPPDEQKPVEHEATPPDEKAPAVEARSAQPEEAQPKPQVEATIPSLRAQQAKIFINNYKISASYGCYSDLDTTGILTCGPEGKSSHVTWKFLYRSPDGDVYEIARTYPAIESTFQLNHEEHVKQFTSDTKQVLFDGTTMVVFEDEDQRVILYPADVTHPPTIDDRTPRVP